MFDLVPCFCARLPGVCPSPEAEFTVGEQLPFFSGRSHSQAHPTSAEQSLHHLSFTSTGAILNEMLTYAEPRSLQLQNTGAISSLSIQVGGLSRNRAQCCASAAGALCVHGTPRLDPTLGMLRTQGLEKSRLSCPASQFRE